MAATETADDPTAARLCFAAAHVVLRADYRALGHRLERPGDAATIARHLDWDATMSLRRWLDAQGFGIAEAMDTAQRFFLGWTAASELIRRTGQLALRGGFCAGAGTDHRPPPATIADLAPAVIEQCRFVQQHGGIPVILPMPLLSQRRCGPRDYVAVYTDIVAAVDGPLFVHWLGPMFLPSLQGYFPGDSLLEVTAIDRSKVRGVKLSLLDDALELRVRRALLPHAQIVLTGDDFHFGRLILGGDPVAPPPPLPPRIERHTRIGRHDVALGDFSHALLGVFDAIAAPFGTALRALARGNVDRYLQAAQPCEALGRHVFAAPTQHYKAGLAFLSWLAGRQPNAMLVNREDLLRDRDHYRRCAELAFACGAVDDDAAARARLRQFLAAEQDR